VEPGPRDRKPRDRSLPSRGGITDNQGQSDGRGHLKLRLEDQGEGWFWADPAITVDVVAEARLRGRRYYKVAFDPPLELQEAGACTPSGLLLVIYPAAWLSSRWVGHEINPDSDTSAFLWLAQETTEAIPPPAGTAPSIWAMCRRMK
jgi:hypothetical protein